MNIASTMRTRTRRVALAAVVAAATISSVAAATAAASPPAATPASASGAADVFPSGCGGEFHHIVGGRLDKVGYDETGLSASKTLGTISFGGVVETPKTTAFVRRTFDSEIILAVRNNGSLWRIVTNDDGIVSTSQISASGWGGVRDITGSHNFNRMYALTTSGGLYRYSMTADGTPRSRGAISATGWSGVKFLSTAHDERYTDTVVGVSTRGALLRYSIHRETGATSGVTLRSSGWGSLTQISLGGCLTSGVKVPMIGVHYTGALFGYMDANLNDRSGADITGVGMLGTGFKGLVTE